MVASTLTAYSDDPESDNANTDEPDSKKHPGPDVQMVFKDCIPLTTLRESLQRPSSNDRE